MKRFKMFHATEIRAALAEVLLNPLNADEVRAAAAAGLGQQLTIKPGAWSDGQEIDFMADVVYQVVDEPAVYEPMPWWAPERWKLRSEYTGRLRWPWDAFRQNPSQREVKPAVVRTVRHRMNRMSDGSLAYIVRPEDEGHTIRFETSRGK